MTGWREGCAILPDEQTVLEATVDDSGHQLPGSGPQQAHEHAALAQTPASRRKAWHGKGMRSRRQELLARRRIVIDGPSASVCQWGVALLNGAEHRGVLQRLLHISVPVWPDARIESHAFVNALDEAHVDVGILIVARAATSGAASGYACAPYKVPPHEALTEGWNVSNVRRIAVNGAA